MWEAHAGQQQFSLARSCLFSCVPIGGHEAADFDQLTYPRRISRASSISTET